MIADRVMGWLAVIRIIINTFVLNYLTHKHSKSKHEEIFFIEDFLHVNLFTPYLPKEVEKLGHVLKLIEINHNFFNNGQDNYNV